MPGTTQETFENIWADTTHSGAGAVRYNRMRAKHVTFKSGLDVPVHRWFRLTPSFGPELVREMLTTMGAQKGELILDPFAGASTTLIEAQLLGYEAIGFEINPLLQFVGEASLHWECKIEEVAVAIKDITTEFMHTKGSITFETLQENGLVIPPIHNPTRWWRPDILTELLILKRAINKCVANNFIRRLLLLALAGALVPDLTNVTLGRLQLHFIERSKDEIDVFGVFTRKAQEIIHDLTMIQSACVWQQAKLLHQDATQLDGFRPSKKISVVVTSPPYPNRYSYVWNTRPHLFFFDFFSQPRQSSDLDIQTIGGTWGTATSMLMKGVVAATHPIVEQIVGGIVAEIRKQDNLMANYLMRYFNLLTQQILAIVPHLSEDARIAYVVGCSELKGVFVETDVLLGELFQRLGVGLRLDRIERIRKRNSGKDLHESIVYAYRG